MRGFKEDFESWRSSLTPEEQQLVQKQAVGEFNKKFRKSDEFKKDLPEEKVKSFSKILGKFFDAESADYKKEVAAKVPNYNRLLEKAGDKVLDFEMKNRIVTIDRDADRRYTFATRTAEWLKAKGHRIPAMSPLIERGSIKNDDAESHEQVKKAFSIINDLSAEQKAKLSDQWAKLLREKGLTEEQVSELKFEIPTMPAMGENLELEYPKEFAQQLESAYVGLKPLAAKHLKEKLPELKAMGEKVTDEELAEAQMTKEEYLASLNELVKDLEEGKEVELGAADLQESWERIVTTFASEFVDTTTVIDKMVEESKKFFRGDSRNADKYKTKADVAKAIWAELPKFVNKAVPPLDEELLAELEELPAVREDEFQHPWGYADMLYKSEAIDAFGMKYLLGVFETKEEAREAFVQWNAEYVKSRAEMKAEMQQWSKQENARLEADTSGADRIRKILEEARR